MGVIYQIIGDYLSDNWGVFISWLGITYQFTLGIYFVLPRIEYLLMVGVEHHQNWSCTMKMPGQRALQLGQVFAPAWPLVPQRKKRRRHDNRTSRTSVVSEVLPLKKKSCKAKTPFGDFATLQTKVWQRTRQKPLNTLGSLDHAGPVWHMRKKILQSKSIHGIRINNLHIVTRIELKWSSCILR